MAATPEIRVEITPFSSRARNIAEGKKVRWTDGVEAMWVLVKHRLRRG